MAVSSSLCLLLLLLSVSITTGLTTTGLTPTSTPSEECLEKEDVNTSLVRLENKTTRLETKMVASFRHQETSFNFSTEQLEGNVHTSLARLENKTTRIETKMDQMTRSINASFVKLVNKTTKMSKITKSVVTSLARLEIMVTNLDTKIDEFKNSLSCPDGWHYDKDAVVCLKPFEEGVPWDVAKERCENVMIGGRLAILDTSAKRRFAHRAIDTMPRSSWVGARQDDGQFKWLDGHDVTSGWRPGQPRGVYDCVVLLYDGDNLDNYECGRAYFFLCELPLI